MAAIVNTVQTYGIKGIREQLSEIISNISPTEFPFTSNAGKGEELTNTFYEWQQDALAAADTTNARVEGNDHTAFTAITPTKRIGNYAQISDKDVIVSGTTDKVKKAGRASETGYQVSKRAKELKKDIEAICLANQAAVAGDSVTPRKTAALLAYLVSNVDHDAATGVNPPALTSGAPTTARTDGTLRNIAESQLQNVVQLMYTSGGKVDGATLMVAPSIKPKVSAFAGIATKTFHQTTAKQAVIVAGADVYVSDFGIITVVPNRFQRPRDAFLLDFEMVKMRDLRPYEVQDLAKTGDAVKKLLLREWGLEVTNEAGLGLIADIQ